MATVEKRGSAFRIVVSSGYNLAGRQVRRTMTWKPEPGMTGRQVQRELEKQIVLFENKCAGGSAGCNMKFEEFARRWFVDDAEGRLRPRTLALMHSLEERTYKAIGHLRMAKITSLHINEFMKNLAEPGVNHRTGEGLSVKTRQHYLSFISSVFSYAQRMDLLQDNPARRVKLPKNDQPEKKIYTLEQAQAFLDGMAGETMAFQAFFVLAIYGGFRKSEILGLQWGDFDFDSCTVSVRRSSLYTKGKGTFTDALKTRASQRTLKLPVSVFDILHQYRREQASNRLKLGDRWEDHDRLFTTWDGRPMSTSTPLKWLEKYCAKIGLPCYGIHSFRHLNASLLINAGVDVKTVSSSLGHSQPNTTLHIYAHTFEAAQARASEAVAAALPLGQKKA